MRLKTATNKQAGTSTPTSSNAAAFPVQPPVKVTAGLHSITQEKKRQIGNEEISKSNIASRSTYSGFGCDTEAVINILAHQDSTQRAHIQHEYRTVYSDDILKHLSSEVSGKLETITFGDKSRMGRGRIDAKVKAASNAAYSGTPVVIARMAMNSVRIVFKITL
ncbi:hypothetical protein L1887_36060 [Cichorium endivia]|nr:hypothetical protein L1887_36060 [Cichorium endivia]